ncbi:hypothetical protein [Microbacterium xanthum]|uniref:hypothetical protein n=1 Tax=Microbacterium xanthum TaxID=3079794 RepID=UPI002AD4AE22|nr:hypothetical protein [Microbacterium sp. KSW-48]MDZ8172186.1 hypothetical protein [Microbacterium sp. KSW-48]
MLGALRGEPRHTVRMAAGVVVLIAAVAAGCWALVTLDEATPEVFAAVAVMGGAAITLGFGLAPVVTGSPDPLDPRRFGVVGIAPRPLAAVLVLAGMVSVPVWAVLALAVTTAVVWGSLGVPVWAGLVSVLLIVLTSVLLARVAMAVTAMFLRERRSRELSSVLAVGVLVVVVPVVVFLASLEWQGSVPAQLMAAVRVLSLTPFGAAWALPGAILTGQSVALTAAVSVATPLTLGAAWLALVTRVLSTTERPVSVKERGGLGWFNVAPGTPTGAVAARSLVYWLRDPRHIVNVVVIPVAAAILIVPLLLAGVPAHLVAIVPVPIIALFLGWLPHNDLAYDSTAVWMHIASGLHGVADRVGRLVPVVLLGVPLLAIGIPVAVSLHGRWMVLPAMVGVCASLFLCGLGLSSIASVVGPYPVSRPGDSPFQQPQRTGASGALSQSFVMLGTIVLSAPVLWWAWHALGGDLDAAEHALWGGLGIGVVVLAVGIAIGGGVFRRRGSRIMEFAEAS